MPFTKPQSRAVLILEIVVLLLSLRGFLAGRTPPASAQDFRRYSAPPISADDARQDEQIHNAQDEIVSIRARITKQNDKLDDVNLRLAAIDAKVAAQSNFWSMQNGGVGFGVLAMLGLQVTPMVRRRRRGPEPNLEG